MKRCLLICGIFCLFAFGFLALFPTILSSNWLGKPIIQYVLARTADGDECSYKDLSIGWFTPLTLTDFSLSLHTPTHPTITVQECRSEHGLLYCLFHLHDVGTLEITSPHLLIPVSKTFPNISSEPGKKTKKKEPLTDPFTLDRTNSSFCGGRIVITDAQCTIVDEKKHTLFLLDLSTCMFHGDFSPEGQFTSAVEGSVYDAIGHTHGDIHTAIKFDHKKSIQGNCSISVPSISLHMVEALLETFGKKLDSIPPLHEVIGPSQSLSLQWSGTTQGTAKGEVLSQSKNVHVSLPFSLHGSKLTIEPTNILRAEMTPAGFKSLSSFYKLPPMCTLIDTLHISLDLKEPFYFNFEHCSVEKPCVLALHSQDTHWQLNGNSVYSQCHAVLHLDGNKGNVQTTTLLKKDTSAESKSSTMDFGAQFSFDPAGLTIPSFDAHISCVPSFLSSEVSGQPFKISASAQNIYIPFGVPLPQLTEKLTLASSFSFECPVIEYKNKKVFENFSIKGSATKKSGEEDLLVDINQQATVAEVSGLAHILGWIPSQGKAHSILDLKTGLLTCKASLKSKLAETESSLEIKDISHPLHESHASLTCSSQQRLNVQAKIDCAQGTLHIQPLQKSKPLFCATIDQPLLDSLKKLDLLAQKVHIASPAQICMSECQLNTHFDQSLGTLTSLDGEVRIQVDPLTLRIQDQSVHLAAMEINTHIEDAHETKFVVKSIPNKDTVSETSISGTCTISYSQPLYKLSLDTMAVRSSLSLRAIPSSLISLFGSKNSVVADLLAPDFSVSFDATSDKLKTGDVKFQLTSSHVKCHLDSAHIQDGILSLQSPLKATCRIDKERSKLLFQKLAPFFASEIEKEHEISFTVFPEKTSIPLKNWSLQKVTLPKIELLLGQMEVKSAGALKSLLRLIHDTSGDNVSIWFTPILLSVQNGTAILQRADMQTNHKLHFFAWGSINLVSKTLLMYAAIPNETLVNVGLSLSIPRPLLVPIQGDLSSPKIDTMKAAARIAGAGASSYSKSDSQDSEKGHGKKGSHSKKTSHLELLGQALQVVSTIGDEDIAIPPPLVHPFPWD